MSEPRSLSVGTVAMLDAEVIDWICVATVCLGPGLLIVLGLLLRWASLRSAASAA